MSFDVGADAYGRFMGRYADPLAPLFADWAGVAAGQRALDVGCGPGALTAQLVERLGADHVAALDPSESFVAATSARFPEVAVHTGVAERLPFPDDTFDVTLAQLVVHFMRDPVVGFREMARVTRAGGVVAACVWDHAGSSGPLSLFWEAVHEGDRGAAGEAGLAGAREGHLVELAEEAGLRAVEHTRLKVAVPYRTFYEWWEPFTLGVGPAGAYVTGLDDPARSALRSRCAARLPTGSFEVLASAWCVRARAA